MATKKVVPKSSVKKELPTTKPQMKKGGKC